MVMMYLKIAFSLCGASESIVCCLAAHFESHFPFVFISTLSELISCARDRHNTGVDVEDAAIVAIDFRECGGCGVHGDRHTYAHFNLSSLHTGIMSRCFILFFHFFSLAKCKSVWHTASPRRWWAKTNCWKKHCAMWNLIAFCLFIELHINCVACFSADICSSPS